MTFSDRFSPDKNIVNLYRPDWTVPDWFRPFRPVQTGSDWTRMVQNGPD